MKNDPTNKAAWTERIVPIVRGALKSASDAHSELGNYHGLITSVEKRLIGALKPFIKDLLKESEHVDK